MRILVKYHLIRLHEIQKEWKEGKAAIGARTNLPVAGKGAAGAVSSRFDMTFDFFVFFLFCLMQSTQACWSHQAWNKIWVHFSQQFCKGDTEIDFEFIYLFSGSSDSLFIWSGLVSDAYRMSWSTFAPIGFCLNLESLLGRTLIGFCLPRKP